VSETYFDNYEFFDYEYTENYYGGLGAISFGYLEQKVNENDEYVT